jgi:hypothetical protein
MAISQVQARNFKGRDFALEFNKGRVLLIGPNESGKSSVAEAATLALMGYLPGGKKTAADIFRRCATDYSQPMSATAVVCGHEAHRVYTPKNKDGTSVSVTTLFDGKKTKDLDALLASVGAGGVFDLTAWLAASDNRKLDILLSLTGEPQDDKLMDTITRERAAVNEARAKVRTLKEAIGQWEARVAALEAEAGGDVPALRAEVEAAGKNKQEAEIALSTHDFAVHAHEAWQAVAKQLQEASANMPTAKETGTAREEFETARSRYKAMLDAQKTALATAQRVLVEQSISAAQAKALQGVLCASCVEHVAEFVEEGDGRRTQAEELIADAGAEVEKANEAFTAARKRLDTLQDSVKKVKELEAATGEAPEYPPTDRDVLSAALSAASLSVHNRSEELTKAVAALEVKGAGDKLKQDLAEAEKAVEVHKGRVLRAENRRAEVMESTAKIIGRAMAIVGPTAQARITEAGELKIGLEREGVWVPYQSWSGGQRVLFVAAMGGLVQAISKDKISLITVEAAEADETRLTGLCRWMVPGAGDATALVLTCHTESGKTVLRGVEGWQAINLEKTPLTIET